MTLLRGLLLANLYYLPAAPLAPSKGAQAYDCSDIYERDHNATSGIYRIQPKGSNTSFQVYCEMSNNKGLTLIQRHDGSDGLSFDRKWGEYREGFGALEGEQWLGLRQVYALTHQKKRPCKLYISIGDFDGQEAYAEYGYFTIGNESTSYALHAGKYSGTAGNAFAGIKERKGSNQNGQPFSTSDHAPEDCGDKCVIGDMMFTSCASLIGAGWWYNACVWANLNGVWHSPPNHKDYLSSVAWPTWRTRESLKFSKMYLIHS